MKDYDIVHQHEVIRETIGYDSIKDVELYDLPEVIRFLTIVYNYNNMLKITEIHK